MKIKYKLLNENAKCPVRAYDEAAAWDMFAASLTMVEEDGYAYLNYGTGLALEIPSGYVGKIFPRSSISKTGLILCNSVGIIDPDFRGEISFRFKWIRDFAYYSVGERIGQIRLEKTIPILWVATETLTETLRGEGGYGSTGK